VVYLNFFAEDAARIKYGYYKGFTYILIRLTYFCWNAETTETQVNVFLWR
jgi:hypothetical protein